MGDSAMPRSPFETSRVHIIFAEDDLVFREIATPAILRVGIPEESIHMAEDGLEALECLESLQSGDANDPIVMLLDMRMPTMDGQTCAVKVKELREAGKLKRKPYLVCCSAGVEQVSFGGEDGADSVFHLTMPKPFSNKEVALVLENAERWWADGATLCGETPVPVAGGGGSTTFNVNTLQVIVLDDEPICRMALTTALTFQGVDEDKVVECENVGEAVQALQQAQANPGAPLMLVLAQERWSEMIGDLGSLSRKPFLVSTSGVDLMPNSTRFDAVLPSGFHQADLKDLMDKFQFWWAR